MRFRGRLKLLLCGVSICFFVTLYFNYNLASLNKVQSIDFRKGEEDSLPTKRSLSSLQSTSVQVDSQRPTDKEVVRVDPSVCDGPWPAYPNCESKMEWMAAMWQSDPCYASYGVNGSRCSFQQYLSEIEFECPLLPWRKNEGKSHNNINKAHVQTDLEPLKDVLLHSNDIKYKWIIDRIISLWPKWVSTVKSMEAAKPLNHSSKKVLLYLGLLSDKAGFHIGENAYSGGPLGELVQWSDLIASLYVLGYKLDFSHELVDIKTKFQNVGNADNCRGTSLMPYDVIYTDIVGIKHFRAVTKHKFERIKCLFRVLDSFGTEPIYNFKLWKPYIIGDMGKTWGNWNLQPRQFMTMFPHTPDNSFLGFVIDVELDPSVKFKKKHQGLVYGKESYMWEDKRDYLDILSKYMDIHATVTTEVNIKNEKVENVQVEIPGFVFNHEILPRNDLFDLLKQTKVFIGLGFPYEGPAPLEAIALGCIFLNPLMKPPISRTNSKFLASKPTERELTSQHPYTEHFIGQPHVITFDMKNSTEVNLVVSKVMKMEPPDPYLPFEFTMEGMLERLLVYNEHQSYCPDSEAKVQWPPSSELITKLSNPGDDCKTTCYNEDLICDPDLFPLINRESVFEEFEMKCPVESRMSHTAPSYSKRRNKCFVNSAQLLLGCAGKDDTVVRICPCRTYRKGQIALCNSCTR